MTGRVISIGNAMVDVVAPVPRLPERGGDVLASDGRVEVGGGGFRALVAASSAGAEAVYAGRIGTGPSGDLVRTALATAGVATLLPPVPGQDTGFVVALLEPDGERTFATVRGAESADPLVADVEIRRGDHLHVHGYGLVEPARAAVVASFVTGLPSDVVVLLDPGPFGASAEPAALAELLSRVDWWSGNGAEARAATGVADPANAARRLSATVRRGAVVRLGERGCVLALRDEPPLLLRAPSVIAVDTIGAGDTHVGTFLALLATGVTPHEAAHRANAAAAHHVSARPNDGVRDERRSETGR